MMEQRISWLVSLTLAACALCEAASPGGGSRGVVTVAGQACGSALRPTHDMAEAERPLRPARCVVEAARPLWQTSGAVASLAGSGSSIRTGHSATPCHGLSSRG